MKSTHYAMAAQRPGGPDVLELTDVVLAPPGPGELQIAHRAIGVNFIDCYFRSGLYPWPDPGRLAEAVYRHGASFVPQDRHQLPPQARDLSVDQEFFDGTGAVPAEKLQSVPRPARSD